MFTVDFITPIVDEPEDFGAIAAANSLSDVYAMGGEPQIALAICGFPEELVGADVLVRIFRGGREKAAEAGCAIAGGHTVIDPELKYGLCVLGTVPEGKALAQTGARAGDRLVLTKPIGTGIGAQALKKGRLGEAELAEAVSSMKALNRGAKRAALEANARAATDVTGFGLLGHLHHLLAASRFAAALSLGAVPLFSFARELVGEGHVPGGTRRNLEFVSEHISWAEGLDEVDRLVLCDAQTSGGLLIAVPAEHEALLLGALEREGTPAAASIGSVTEGPAGRIQVT